MDRADAGLELLEERKRCGGRMQMIIPKLLPTEERKGGKGPWGRCLLLCGVVKGVEGCRDTGSRRECSGGSGGSGGTAQVVCWAPHKHLFKPEQVI